MPRPDENLYAVLEGGFAAHAADVCMETPAGDTWSYAELGAASARIAKLLVSLGARPGDRVAVQVPKSPQALFLYLACVRAGLVYLPLNTGYTRRELDYFVSDAEPTVVVGTHGDTVLPDVARNRGVTHVLALDREGAGELSEAAAGMSGEFRTVPRGADDLAAILYTSGTTGLPKGAMLSHGNLASNALTLHAAWGFRPGDVLLHALPIFHTHGLFVACHCALLNASRMLFLPRFDLDEVLRALPRATVMMGVPTFYTRLLADPRLDRAACAHMRLFVSGSAPLLEQTAVEFRERTGHAILERYGMTETGMNTSNPLDGARKPGTVGFPLPGVQVRIAGDNGGVLPRGDIGVIEIKGPNVFKGYWRMPDKTAEEFTADGWFRSGDLGRIDEDGYVCIVGRGKDLIISGGYNVYPKEVELCIDQITGVEESAVIGLPDPDFGEAVTAVVVRDATGAGLDEATLTGQLRGQLAGYKVPKRVHFVDALPRNTMGKVQKNVLRQRYGTET